MFNREFRKVGEIQMSIYLVESTIDAYDELSRNPQNTMYYRVMNERDIGDLCEQLTLERETYFAVTQLTRENFRDVISKISDDSSREEALMSVLEQVKW